MAGVNSLGLASGTLTSDLLDKLKAADTTNLVTPTDKKLAAIKTKQSDLSTLTIGLSSLKSAAMDLAGDTTYLKRSTSSTAVNNEVALTASDGVTPQSFNVSVSQLAQNDILQSSGFASTSASVSSVGTTLSIKSGSTAAINLSVSAGTTLEQLAQKINDASGGSVIATMLNTGSSTNPYRLILKGANTGAANTISVSEGSGLSLGLASPSVSGSAATTSALAGTDGDIKINGTSIGAISTSSSNSSEQNAQLFVVAINAKYASTGIYASTDGAGALKLASDGRGIIVEATATGASASGLSSTTTGTVYTGSATASTANTTGVAGDIKINGISIAAVNTLSTNTAEQNAQLLLTAINAKTTETGVTAITDTAGKLSLYSDGRSIDLVTTANGATASGLTVGAQTVPTISGFSKLQSAQDTKFTMDGISMSRASNTINDIVSGVTFNLNKVTTSSITLAIKQDTASIPKMVSAFVSAYNAAVSKVTNLTAYNSGTKTAASLQGVSEVSGLATKFANILTSRDSNGRSLMDYGFTLDKSGTLNVDSMAISSALASDPKGLEAIFKGSSKIVTATYSALRTAATTNSTGTLGDITINGISMAAVNTLSTNTAEQNAQLFVAAINDKTLQTDTIATTDGAGKIVLSNKKGGRINLSTTSMGASASGLSADSTVSKAISSTLVASGSNTSTSGIFSKLNSSLATLVSGSTSTLSTYSTSLTTQTASENKSRDEAIARITSKYDIMAKQFASYDAMISKYTQRFASLKQQMSSASSATG